MNKSQLELQNKRLKAKLDAILKQKENAGIKLQFADIKVSLENVYDSNKDGWKR